MLIIRGCGVSIICIIRASAGLMDDGIIGFERNDYFRRKKFRHDNNANIFIEMQHSLPIITR